MSNLTIYFKSGNKVTIDKVTEWDVSYIYSDITRIGLIQNNPKNKLIIESIDLSSIECIIEHD